MQLATVQSASVVQVFVASLLHIPLTQVPTDDVRHATTSFERPHVDWAPHRTTVLRQRCFSPAARPASFVAWATQRTYCPWFFHGVGVVPTGPAQGQAAAMVASADATAVGSHVLPLWPPPLPCPPGIAALSPPASSRAAAVKDAMESVRCVMISPPRSNDSS
jgi:hypothetical protein